MRRRRRPPTRPARWIAAAIAMVHAALLPGAAWAQGVIELRSSARQAQGEPLRLADVARLEGPDAAALADVVVLPPPRPTRSAPAPTTVDIEQLRRAIAGAREVNWSRLVLRGSRCVVLPPAAPPPQPIAPAGPQVTHEPAGGTLRDAVLARIAQLADVEPSRVRVRFDSADEPALATPTAGRAVEVNAAGRSDRLPLQLAVYDGDRTVLSRTIRVEVEVRRPVLRTRGAIPRGETLDPASLDAEDAWLPLTARPTTPEQLAGAVAQSRLPAGEIVMPQHVAPALAARKGEIVSVRVVSGSVVVATRARALAAAREGELVRLQSLDGAREFVARLDGRARAVVGVGATPADEGVSAPATTRRSAAGPRPGDPTR